MAAPRQITALALFTPGQTARKTRSLGSTLVGLAALVGLLHYGRDFFVTVLISAVFAFILDPAVVLVMKLRVPRSAATGIVILFSLIAVYVLGLAAWYQVAPVADDLPAYSARLNEVWGKANEHLDAFEKRSIAMVVPKTLRDQDQQIQQKPIETLRATKRRRAAAVPSATPTAPFIQEVKIHTEPRPFLATAYGYVSGYTHALVMATFVPFLVYFMLSWRDHFQRGILRLFDGEARFTVARAWSGIGDTTRAYVIGNFLLWIFLSSLSAVAFFILGVPYWAVVALISALLSLVPYVGLPLAVLPPVLAAVAIPNRFKIILIVALVTVILHVVAMNFLYAKIIGRRVRLNPLVVTVALMFWGVIWGGIGLLLAVPVTAGIKTVCDSFESLEPYGRILGDSDVPDERGRIAS